MKRNIALMLVILTLGVGTGCVIGVGNRDRDHPRAATLGQELIDLESARESGALSNHEYEEQRRRLLRD